VHSFLPFSQVFLASMHLTQFCSAGKMVLLDKLLPKLKERDSRVLIFSQVFIGSYTFRRGVRSECLEHDSSSGSIICEKRSKDGLLHKIIEVSCDFHV
jgi:hypothetical protein